ncbi:twin-arginine translocation signal domain-containing protein [Microbacterium caowuchunii]|nr:twin-arginine translocation signal domain-containing protein [Microbacterium caowuchunii]
MAPHGISRRTLLRGGSAVGAALLLSGCAPVAAAPAPATPTPEPQPWDGGTGRPATRPSYGPNGTHYPAETPWMGEPATHELVADCSWIDISRKVQGLTAEQVAEGAVVRVRPGTLAGAGWTSSARPALSGVGSVGWDRKVLVVPLEGFGSVTVSDAGIRFDQCANLAFFGFLSSGGFALTRCAGIEIGWSRFAAANITRGGRDLSFYELVLGFRQNAEDTAGIRPTETFEMTGISRYGCTFGPSVKPAGSDAHCDTVQLEGTGTGTFGPFVNVDCVDYGSSNAAMLLHDRLSYAEYRHCMIIAGDLPWRVYPLRDGDYRGTPNAFSGGCGDVRLSDCIVSGAIGRLGFTVVERTALSYAPVRSQQPSISGGWSVDTSIAGWGGEQIMAPQELADYEVPTLRACWTW